MTIYSNTEAWGDSSHSRPLALVTVLKVNVHLQPTGEAQSLDIFCKKEFAKKISTHLDFIYM